MRFNYQSPKTLIHDAIYGKMQAYFSHQAVGVSEVIYTQIQIFFVLTQFYTLTFLYILYIDSVRV